MSIPNDRKYVSSHEWIRAEGDVMVVGITDPAQDQLGDLVYVGDVRVGAKLKAGETAGVVESVKAASDIYAPVDGEVVGFNSALNDAPETINTTPTAPGFLNSSRSMRQTSRVCLTLTHIRLSLTQGRS